MRGDAVQVDSVDGPRWELALDRLRAGHTLIYKSVGSTRAETSARPGRGAGRLKVLIQSSWLPKNATRTRALEDLEIGRTVFEELKAASPEIRDLSQELGVAYELIERGNKLTVEIGQQSCQCRPVDPAPRTLFEHQTRRSRLFNICSRPR